jgi:hypothetical protein
MTLREFEDSVQLLVFEKLHNWNDVYFAFRDNQALSEKVNGYFKMLPCGFTEEEAHKLERECADVIMKMINEE